jgi:hypothetical protein
MGNMKHIYLLAVILFSSSIYSQEVANIRVKSKYGVGTTILKGEKEIDKDALYYALRKNVQALGLVRKGMRQQSFSHIFAYVGMAMIGYPFGASILGSEHPRWALIPAGTALILIGLPVFNGGANKVKRGMRIYRGDPESAYNHSSEYAVNAFMVANRGLAITFRF